LNGLVDAIQLHFAKILTPAGSSTGCRLGMTLLKTFNGSSQ